MLLVDDDQDMLRLLAVWLKASGIEVQIAQSGSEALTRIAVDRPDLVITDLVMEGMDGLALISEIHASNPLLPIVMLSGQAQIADAVKATHLGTVGFLSKPVMKDVFIHEVRSHLAIAHARRVREGPFGAGIICRSVKMRELLEQAEMIAESDVTVFIRGETGTGKEVLARAIHAASPRRARPFVGINCGAIPEQLLESELFGHERGAFTGAHTRHEGLLVAADGGTVFLDEIGDMPPGLQVKLLRVLQDLEVRPVGSTKSVAVDIRIISATHHDLDALVAAGDFRQDLYYRLNVVPLVMPNLGERREDIAVLLDYFLTRHATKTRARAKRFEADAMTYLTAAAWPGNVRQLANVVELCVTLTRGEVIPLALAQRALGGEAGRIQTLKDARDEFDKKYLISVMRVANGNVASAARIAGRNRTEFYKLLSMHGLDAGEFKSAFNATQDEEAP